MSLVEMQRSQMSMPISPSIPPCFMPLMRKINYVIGCTKQPVTTSPLSWFDRLSCIFDGGATLMNVDPNKPVDSSLLHNADEET